MMNWIVRTALNLRAVVVVAGIVLMIAGVQTIRSTPLDVFPEFAPPLVEIQTEAPGLSTAEVESLIARERTTPPASNGSPGPRARRPALSAWVSRERVVGQPY